MAIIDNQIRGGDRDRGTTEAHGQVNKGNLEENNTQDYYKIRK